MQEIVPGVFHWTARHPRIGADVHSYYLPEERVLLDPMVPAEGLDWFESVGAPETILLTNRHHYRQSDDFVKEFGCAVRASRPGMHEFSHGEPVEPFDFGDELPGGVIAHEVGAICPDETALEIPARRALACADGLVRANGGPGFVPDRLLGDDAEAVKRGLREAYGELAELDVDALLLAHGDPFTSGARDLLREIAASG